MSCISTEEILFQYENITRRNRAPTPYSLFTKINIQQTINDLTIELGTRPSLAQTRDVLKIRWESLSTCEKEKYQNAAISLGYIPSPLGINGTIIPRRRNINTEINSYSNQNLESTRNLNREQRLNRIAANKERRQANIAARYNTETNIESQSNIEINLNTDSNLTRKRNDIKNRINDLRNC